jgi:hypothetical protein
MKQVLFSAATLLFAITPIAANAAPVTAAPKHAICIPMEIQGPDGPIEGMFCYMSGGRL